MNDQKLLEPINYYVSELKDACKQITDEVFQGLVERSAINIEENKKTVNELNKTNEKIKQIKSSRRSLKFLNVLFVLITLGLSLLLSYYIYCKNRQIEVNVEYLIGSAVGIVVCIVILFLISNKMKKLSSIKDSLENKADSLLSKARSEVYSLNLLLNQEQFLNIAERTLPSLKLLRFSSTPFLIALNNLKDKYDGSINYIFYFLNEDVTVSSVLTGTIDKKLFLYISSITFTMKPKVYYGSDSFPYYETYRDEDGNYHEELEYETLTASVTKLCPYYSFSPYAMYFSPSCKNLSFSRVKCDYNFDNDYALKSTIKSKEKKLIKEEKKAIKEGRSFTAMTNTEFELLFNSTRRSDDKEFRMLYTPLATKNFIELVKSKEGYKDNFTLQKEGMVTVCIPESSEYSSISMRPSICNCYSHSFEEIQSTFKNTSRLFFKNLYFALAPMFMIPIYADSDDITLDDERNTPIEQQQITFFDAESVANSSPDLFRPYQAVTTIIRKAKFIDTTDIGTIFEITSSGFEILHKTESVYCHGVHTSGYVDVPYDEYIEHTKTSYMLILYLGLADGYVINTIRNIENYKTINYTYSDGFLAFELDCFSAEEINNPIIRKIISSLKNKE